MDFTPILSEFGAIGVLIVSFGLILRWVLNESTKRMEQIHGGLLRQTDIFIEHITINSMILVSMQETLLRHDAQVRGINRAFTDDTVMDDVQMAIEIQKQALTRLDEIRSRLNEIRSQHSVSNR